MRFHMKLVVLASFVAIISAQPQQYEFQSQPSSGFVSAQQSSDEQVQDSTPSATVNHYRTPQQQQQQQQVYEYEDQEENVPPQADHANRRQQGFIRKGVKLTNKQILEEIEEQEEPDRLTELLEKSSFECQGRTGYYADEGLGCEVFHYCQENQKHSWICPEGFTFHQVHLICMPPSGDSICEQSSKYHIVNDYLYKPINSAEHESKPNITLRYSERYYPESFYQDERQERQDYQQERQRQPLQVGIRKVPTTPQPTYRQQIQSQQHNVYRAPEDINISLQQRRPQIVFSPTTARYPNEAEEYNYEK